MADENQTLDPFKPPMPRIPGVPERRPDEEPAPRRRRADSRYKLWVTWALLGVLALGAGIAWRSQRHSSNAAPAPAPETTAAPTNVPPPAAVPVPRDGSAEVATVEELAKHWSYKKFTFTKKLSGEPVPAIVVRLPGGTGKEAQSYWAFSLQAPFNNCELEYVVDLAKLAREYGYRAQQPMVVNPCNLTIYHPLHYGTVGGAWVRGQVVQGPGIRPPLAIEVRVEGQRIVATQME